MKVLVKLQGQRIILFSILKVLFYDKIEFYPGIRLLPHVPRKTAKKEIKKVNKTFLFFDNNCHGSVTQHSFFKGFLIM